ncbi:hypothetical protein GCM10007862_20910 [Dyella lipolytica]|uniref:RDD family protein n=1 Tax=Dyella lipolytica TaxID=1867835 RepID=A0ABW8IQY9_9GAMM|nr:RDD family protein [Dyella lipolytica]GLQ47040.1 hypothetical protein GCM10007862_20910 [Dyella lipolytica]
METNPYAAPGAVVDDAYVYNGAELEVLKASRWQRLGAAIIDGLAVGICVMPLSFYVLQGWASRNPALTQSHAAMPNFVSGPVAAVSGVIVLGLIIINCVLLHRNGQTIGKRALSIKVVRKDGSRVPLTRFIFLRFLPVELFRFIPFVGGIIGLVDTLMIFGSERRCMHDLIADTIVIED